VVTPLSTSQCRKPTGQRPGGNQKEATDWFRVCAFNGVGEACAKHLQKGDGIFVEGRLQVRQYDSKQNGKEVSVEIIPSTVAVPGFRARGGSRASNPR